MLHIFRNDLEQQRKLLLDTTWESLLLKSVAYDIKIVETWNYGSK